MYCINIFGPVWTEGQGPLCPEANGMQALSRVQDASATRRTKRPCTWFLTSTCSLRWTCPPPSMGENPRTPSPKILLRPSLASVHAPETPRRRKLPDASGLQGTRPLSDRLQPSALGKRLKERLKLKFEPDAWQLELISRVLRGFDAILLAGTGYGKSLIFEGLAAVGGAKRVVLVISPLKALERDQVRHTTDVSASLDSKSLHRLRRPARKGS